MSSIPTGWINPPADEDGLYEWFRLNRERDPVQQGPRGDWHIFGYPEVAECLANHTDFSSTTRDVPVTSALKLFGPGNLAWMDPPRHRELRSAVSGVFSARYTMGLEPMVDKIIRDQMDLIRGRDTVPFIDGFALPAMLRAIAEMIDLPRSEYPLFARWLKVLWMLTTSGDGQNLVRMLATLTLEMDRVLHELIAERCRDPGDDLVSMLVAPRSGERVFSDDEAAGLVALLIATGEGGATQTLANAIICLDRFPDVRERLRADPSLLGNAIEEIMRYRSQTVRVSRRTVRDIEFAGHAIPAGVNVSVWLASANRDERVFDRPDVFDIDRKDNQHISFGKGAHFCLGAPLGRLQVRIGLGQLLRERVDFSIDDANSKLLDPRIIDGARELVLKMSWPA